VADAPAPVSVLAPVLGAGPPPHAARAIRLAPAIGTATHRRMSVGVLADIVRLDHRSDPVVIDSADGRNLG
jgi:hypothetical protein